MAIGKDRAVLRQLRTLFHVGTIRDLTDGQLLERFAGSRGEAAELAFAVLVERHGPMVLRVCRGVLVDPDEREDAFQATFLVLVKKARALWVRDSLGPWLHQVAYRTASCARSTAARRRRHERRAAMSRQESRHEAGDELGRVLHEEIERLPERYRAPLVLCDLEGRTHEQAARYLGWPIGTVKSRQARGRERLGDRLRRRGLAPNTGLLATALRVDGFDALLPPALVQSTTSAVARFVSVRTIFPGSAASLAQGVLRSMLMTQSLKVASVLFALGATVSGAGLLVQNGRAGSEARSQGNLQAARAYDGPVYAVEPGKLTVTLIEPGNLESSRNPDVFCPVEGQTAIISILPEGTTVKKGQVVCVLDSAALKDQLVNQMTAVQRAEAAYQNAKLTGEVAEIAFTEYVEGIYKQDQATLKGEIVTAETTIQKAEGRLERTRRARKRINDALAASKGATTPADIVAELDIEDRLEAAEQTLGREKVVLGLAKNKLDVLEKYTLGKTIKELKAEIEKTRSDEVAKRETLQLEKAKQAKLIRQIAACTLVAPIDGPVVYANDPHVHNQPQIEEGATVRERQKIFSIPDLGGSMQVLVKVPELMVDQLALGMRGRIKVDAFPEETLAGSVSEVAPLPDASSFFNRDLKVYSTRVKIGTRPAGLRPGMSAQVEILIADLENVLSVPVPAVLRRDQKVQVAVKTPDGRFVWREVILGVANEKSVEIKKGIEPGDRVALNPLALLTDEERNKINPPHKSATNPRPRGRANGKAKRSPNLVDPKNPGGDSPKL